MLVVYTGRRGRGDLFLEVRQVRRVRRVLDHETVGPFHHGAYAASICSISVAK
jgi:hypothetical protein